MSPRCEFRSRENAAGQKYLSHAHFLLAASQVSPSGPRGDLFPRGGFGVSRLGEREVGGVCEGEPPALRVRCNRRPEGHWGAVAVSAGGPMERRELSGGPGSLVAERGL